MISIKASRRTAMLSACALLLAATPLLAQQDSSSSDSGAAAGAAGCFGCGFFAVIMVAAIALNIALLVWIAKDSKARGMDNSVLWMLLVFFTGLIGLVVYLLVRPPGPTVPCPNCNNKKLPTAVQCPTCGYRTQ